MFVVKVLGYVARWREGVIQGLASVGRVDSGQE
jgi:hypothetical protein